MDRDEDRECLDEDVTICVADDLVSLAQLTDHSILNCLRERFRDDQIYVSLNGMVSGRDQHFNCLSVYLEREISVVLRLRL